MQEHFMYIRRGGVNEKQMSTAIKATVVSYEKPCRFKMSRAVAHCDRNLSPLNIVLLLLILSFSNMLLRVGANPLPDLAQEYQNLLSESSTSTSTDNTTDNSTEIASNTDVYVIKAVIYEIGILTDTDNTTTSESTERHERVDISLYDPPYQEDEYS